MNSKLFDEFKSVSAKQWKQNIQFDLKGADYNNLVWKTNEGISVKPFYHPDDFKTPLKIEREINYNWKICQIIYVANVEKSNKKAIKAIKNGANSISFIIPNKDIKTRLLVKNINLEQVTIHFKLLFLCENFIKKEHSSHKTHNVIFHNDIINNLSKNGNFYYNLKKDFSSLKSITSLTNTLSIDGSLYQNAGANTIQQLAYSLAHANEYLIAFSEQLNLKTKIIFNLAIGSNYFLEIAKLRALRILWKTLSSKYNLNEYCYIKTIPSKRNKTINEHYTNILRSTTEYMSAVLGNANEVCCLPFDSFFKKDNEYSERIGRNQLLILKHECHFDKTNNPADGTYYIETLSFQLAEKALILFKEIEKNGGFLKQLKKGVIQRKIKESAIKEQKQFDTGELILLGTNKHFNINNTLKDKIELYPFIKKNRKKTLIEPIIEKRLSETLEQKILKNEK